MFKIIGNGFPVKGQPGYHFGFNYSAFIWAVNECEASSIYNHENAGAVFQVLQLSKSEALYVEEQEEARHQVLI
jgi:hypothetical protein